MTSRPRISNGVFEDESRKYMFACGPHRADVISKPDYDITVRSNLPFDLVLLAEDWVRGTALDISANRNEDANLVFQMIQDAL